MTKPQGDYTTTDITPCHEQINLNFLWSLIAKEVKVYINRTENSAIRHREIYSFMSGNSIASWRDCWCLYDGRTAEFLLPHLWYLSHREKQKIWDVDDNEYIDYMIVDAVNTAEPNTISKSPSKTFKQDIKQDIKKWLVKNGLLMRALTPSLETYYTQEDITIMNDTMNHLHEGILSIFERYSAPFSAIQSGAQTQISFVPEVANSYLEVLRGLGVGGYHEYFTLYALNRGFVISPWSNILITSPYTTQEDNDNFLTMFDDCIATMLGRL